LRHRRNRLVAALDLAAQCILVEHALLADTLRLRQLLATAERIPVAASPNVFFTVASCLNRCTGLSREVLQLSASTVIRGHTVDAIAAYHFMITTCTA